MDQKTGKLHSISRLQLTPSLNDKPQRGPLKLRQFSDVHVTDLVSKIIESFGEVNQPASTQRSSPRTSITYVLTPIA